MLSTEVILLIISLSSNFFLIFRKIRVIWSPCLVIQCSADVDESDTSETAASSKLKTLLNKITPRKDKRKEIQTQTDIV